VDGDCDAVWFGVGVFLKSAVAAWAAAASAARKQQQQAGEQCNWQNRNLDASSCFFFQFLGVSDERKPNTCF